MDEKIIKLSDILIIFATILGPILAVQAQKAVERFTQSRDRKEKIFYSLMATRLSRLSPEHILSLNSIPLVFGKPRFFGLRRMSRSEKSVLEAWDSYQDVLNTRIDDLNEFQFRNWVDRRDQEFNNLLLSMSTCSGFQFNKLQITKGAYAPIAQANNEMNQQEILQGLAKLFKGEKPLPLSIESINCDQAVMELQQKIQRAVMDALDADGIPINLRRSVKPKRDDNDQ